MKLASIPCKASIGMNLERVVIEVFGGCNYTCRMCPQGSPGRETSFLRKMPLDLFENILDQIVPEYGHPLINLEGSGEPTQAPDLAQYVEACTRRGCRSYIYSNGTGFTGSLMQDCIDAGLNLFRFSVIGYNKEQYLKWMNADNWDMIYTYAQQAQAYSQGKCKIQSYHLVLDNNQTEYEVEQYRKNWIDPLGITAYIWKMHNWSGNYTPEYQRAGKKRSCGRPFNNELTVRAGGINGLRGAVTPCCQVLGPPNESASVLGHFQNQTFEQIYWGDDYNHLRKAHEMADWDAVPYCKDCDFLYDDAEVLAWSNDPTVQVGVPLGTNLEFDQ